MLQFRVLDRRPIRLTGEEARPFLQDLVTNDVERARDDVAVYAALLTPQGKFTADFLVLADDGTDLVLDAAASTAPVLAQALARYRLRRPVGIEDAGLGVAALWGETPEAAAEGARMIADPRHPALGSRLYASGGPDAARAAAAALGAREASDDEWTALRISARAPETGAELLPDTYILEAGFERLNGVDFRKGCFVGQEIVARMKHKTELRRGLLRLSVEGNPPPPGTEVRGQDGRVAGVLGSAARGEALAMMRLDRAGGELSAGEARLRALE